jgi:hypothetical protein
VAAALGQEAHKSIMQQACQRHRHSQILGRGQRKANILVAERRGEGRWLKPAIGNQGAKYLISRCSEDRGGQ